MSSMTSMICSILREASSMRPMASTALLTTEPELSALCLVMRTASLASRALSADDLTVAVISSTAAAVSSSEAAWFSVRFDRSTEDCSISIPLC